MGGLQIPRIGILDLVVADAVFAGNEDHAGWAVFGHEDGVVAGHLLDGAQTEKHQVRMAKEIAKLIEGNPKGIGYLDPAAYERTVDVLMSGESSPVITRKPEGAWTHAIYEKAGL